MQLKSPKLDFMIKEYEIKVESKKKKNNFERKLDKLLGNFNRFCLYLKVWTERKMNKSQITKEIAAKIKGSKMVKICLRRRFFSGLKYICCRRHSFETTSSLEKER